MSLLKKIPLTVIFLAAVLILPLLFPRCANIIPPTGGPRDTIPPELVSSEPPNYSTRFTGTAIRIEFDEFIQLRNINQQFIITPPQLERPEFRVRGRNLLIDLDTELIPNTTYTLNFGEAIVDLNEGNVLTNFEFVFSTGDIIDSLYYSGIVLNAFNNEPEEGVVVMLYDNLHDSVPYRQMPLYARRTGKDGRFRLNNLRTDTFKVFALRDAGNNYLYDQPGEEAIAFLEDLLVPGFHPDAAGPDFLPDTLVSEEAMTITEEPPVTGLAWQPAEPEMQQEPDTIAAQQQEWAAIQAGLHDVDTIPVAGDYYDPAPPFGFRTGDTLFLFKEEAGRQYIRRTERSRPGELLFVFNLPVAPGWLAEPLNFDPPENWMLTERNSRNDSIWLWITDAETRSTESLRFAVSYRADGPSDSIRTVTDTINLNYVERTTTRRQAATAEEPVLEVTFGTAARGNMELNRNLRLSFPSPLNSFDYSLMDLAVIRDNDTVSRSFKLTADSLQIRRYNLITEWLEAEEYRFTALPGAFEDIFGVLSDSLRLVFRTRAKDDYGSIVLNLSGVKGHLIVQLINDRGTVIREAYTGEDTTITFDFLQPGQFRLKAIFDDNENRKWDTGNYLKGIQPERVLFYHSVIVTRANWSIEENWEFE